MFDLDCPTVKKSWSCALKIAIHLIPAISKQLHAYHISLPALHGESNYA